MNRCPITRQPFCSRAITRTKKSLRRPETSGRTLRGGNGASRLAGTWQVRKSPCGNATCCGDWRSLRARARGPGWAQEKTPGSRISRLRGSSGAGRIRTCDLEVMSLASYRAAPPRVVGNIFIGRAIRFQSSKVDFLQIVRNLFRKPIHHGPM